MLIKKTIFILIIFASIFFLNAKGDDKQHEINYGLINLVTLDWSNLDYSEFPLLGASYKYHFSPLEKVDSPIALRSDLGRISWVSLDFNFFTELSPNIGGHYYVNNNWSLEYDFIYDSESYSSSNTKSKTTSLFIDTVINYKINNNFQLGLGWRQVSEEDQYLENINDENVVHNVNSSDNVNVIQARFTSLENSKGWDIKASLSNSNEYSTSKVYSTLYTSKNNGLTFGLVHQNGKSYFSDDITSISFIQNYWFSESASIKYGFSWNFIEEKISNNFVENSSTTKFPLLEVSGTWRF